MTTLIKDLEKCTVDGAIVNLPSEALADYAALRKALLKAGAKYKRNTFVFPNAAQPYMDQLIGGDSIDRKKETQFFETPDSVAEQMVDQILVATGEIRVLEPSAGQGKLIEWVLKRRPEADITAIELDTINYNILMDKYIDQPIEIGNWDFMKWDIDEKYDLIVANPPFTKGQDIEHIRKMYDHLAPGGQLITISSTSWTFNQQKKYQEFKQWIEEIEADVRTNENGAFKSSGTAVSTMMIVIHK